MTDTITAPAVTTDETEAAALEGILPMPADLVPLRQEKLDLDTQIAMLRERVEEIKATFATRAEADGVQGYVLEGKVHARISQVITNRIDSDKLKKTLPHIFNQFIKTTTSQRVTIN